MKKYLSLFILALMLFTLTPATAISVSADMLIGDINDNGEIDSMDYILLKRAYFGTFELSSSASIAGDVNANGEIDAMDYILLKRAYFGTYNISEGGESKPNPKTDFKPGWYKNYSVTEDGLTVHEINFPQLGSGEMMGFALTDYSTEDVLGFDSYIEYNGVKYYHLTGSGWPDDSFTYELTETEIIVYQFGTEVVYRFELNSDGSIYDKISGVTYTNN